MFAISGHASIIQESEKLSEKGMMWINNIIESITKLSRFSEDILDLSKSHIIRDKKTVLLPGLVKDCIHRNFLKHAENFSLEVPKKDLFIHGDWSKLESVFMNFFSNSIEAASKEPLRIQIRFISQPHLLLLVIEDNGIGCDEEQIKNMFRAFYTSKKGKKGTGLGMSISRTIIESHGGRISAYSKNFLNPGEHGLQLQICFPVYEVAAAQEPEIQSNLILITEGIENLPQVIRTFQNVRIIPFVIKSSKDLSDLSLNPESVKIVGSAENLNALSQRSNQFPNVYFLREHNESIYVMEYSSGKPTPFSEEYILSHLS